MCVKKITLSSEAYKVLKAQKRKDESFLDLILQRFGRGSPAAILDYLREREPISKETVDSIRKASARMRKNLKLRRVDL